MRMTAFQECDVTTTLFILNGPAYGDERSYNGLRLAGSLARHDGQQVNIFLLGDAVSCAREGQQVPAGFYNLELMMRSVLRHQGQVRVCGSCMDARGLKENDLTEDCFRSSLDELTEWTLQADKVLVF